MAPTRFLLLTGMVKHGELLRYLLATQVRKRLLEQYGIRRQVKSSAVTGNPDRLFELYYVKEPEHLEDNLGELMGDPDFIASQALIEDTRITLADRVAPLDIPPAVQTLSQAAYYLPNDVSQLQREQALAKDRYLLHVTCTLHENNMLQAFNDHMFTLLRVFERSGLSLVVAGQTTGEITFDLSRHAALMDDYGQTYKERPITILNVWQYEDPESPKHLMAQLAENLTYSKLDRLCDQEQHICRNVSRHYQLYPLLPGAPELL